MLMDKLNNDSTYGTNSTDVEKPVGTKDGRKYCPNYVTSPLYWAIFLLSLSSTVGSVVYITKFVDKENELEKFIAATLFGTVSGSISVCLSILGALSGRIKEGGYDTNHDNYWSSRITGRNRSNR